MAQQNNNCYDAKEQVAEMVRYCQVRKNKGDTTAQDALCRNWIRNYAAQWRDLKNSGVNNPAEMLQDKYLMENQYRWPTKRIRRLDIQRRPKFRTLAEKLALI
jgi:hypothetical protein